MEENLTQLYTYISQNPIETLKSGANISELLSRVWDLTFKGPDNDETRTAQRIIAEKISRIKIQGINRGTYADYAAQLFEVYYQSLRHKFATSNHHGHHQSHHHHHHAKHYQSCKRHHLKHKGLRRVHFSINKRVPCKTPRQLMVHQKRELIERQKQSRLVIAQKKKEEAARQRRAQQIAVQKKKAEAARQRQVQQVAVQKKKAEVARQRQQARLAAAQKKKVKK